MQSWFGRLLALFLIVPIVELALLIWVGNRIGFWPTVGLIALTAFVGAWLARREGWNVFKRLQAKLAAGGLPGRELTDGLIILVSAAFLLTPGVLTDFVGFLGLLPPSRAVIRRHLQARFATSVRRGRTSVHIRESWTVFGSGPQSVEEAEIVEEG